VLVCVVTVLTKEGQERTSSMTAHRRPKRKAAEAALDAIVRLHEQDLLAEKAEEKEDRRRMDIDTDEDSVSFPNGNITLPPEMMISILEFLPTNDLVHRASMVNKAWLVASYHEESRIVAGVGKPFLEAHPSQHHEHETLPGISPATTIPAPQMVGFPTKDLSSARQKNL
jgi:hypothetical protein